MDFAPLSINFNSAWFGIRSFVPNSNRFRFPRARLWSVKLENQRRRRLKQRRKGMWRNNRLDERCIGFEPQRATMCRFIYCTSVYTYSTIICYLPASIITGKWCLLKHSERRDFVFFLWWDFRLVSAAAIIVLCAVCVMHFSWSSRLTLPQLFFAYCHKTSISLNGKVSSH